MSLHRTILFVALPCLFSACASGGATSSAAGTAPVAGGSPRTTWEPRLLEAVKPRPAGVRFDIVVSESPVEATDRRQLIGTLNAENREMTTDITNTTRAPGSYQYRVSWDWQMEPHLGECRFKDLTIKVGYAVDVVRLAGPLAADSSARVWWDGFTERQFDRHVAMLKALRDGARGLYNEMRMMSNVSCATLGTRANDLGRAQVPQIYARTREAGRAVRAEATATRP